MHAEVVNIPDPNLEAAIREELNKPTGDITTDDMALLTSLVASDKSINDLTGLETAINLEDLNLQYNQIVDLSPLTGLTSITQLNLNNNNISGVNPLSGLINRDC